MYSVPNGDSGTGNVATVMSPPGSAKLGKWTQLTGVFYPSHGMMSLYVNGVSAGQASVSAWASAPDGRVRIGNLRPGGSANDWAGRLSNACVLYGALLQADVTKLYEGDSAHPHNGCAALAALYP